MIDLFEPQPWRKDAACIGKPVDWFFPERGDSLRDARATCAACPVCADCLEHALAVPEKHGIWGCTSEKQRRQLRKTRRATLRALEMAS